MTNEQKEKIIELRKLDICYRSITTAMNMYRDKVRNFCKAQGLDGYGKNNNKEWEVKHPILYRHVCYYCGKNFESKAKSAEFCCHKYYIPNGFWRDEDI